MKSFPATLLSHTFIRSSSFSNVVIILLKAILYKESPKQNGGKNTLNVFCKLYPQSSVSGKNVKKKKIIGQINPVTKVTMNKKI